VLVTVGLPERECPDDLFHKDGTASQSCPPDELLVASEERFEYEQLAGHHPPAPALETRATLQQHA